MNNPLIRIRKQVFGVSQATMAAIAKVSQGTVSKWETGELSPDRNEMGRIRDEAIRRQIRWSDAWFFEAAE
jgi:DNA-binding transcriptional regulator YiaG